MEGVKFHPTTKPKKLYSWIFRNYAQSGDKILDTHLGSGSSRIAAYMLGFDFYATEIDKEILKRKNSVSATNVSEKLKQRKEL